MDIIFGLLLIGVTASVVLKISKAGSRPREEDVVERFSALLPGQAEAGDDFLNRLETELYDRNPAFQKTRGNFAEKFYAGGQPMIKVSFDSIYSCYMSYEAQGKDLYLAYALHKKNSIISLIPILGPIIEKMTVIVFLSERNKLLSFTAVTIDCMRKATDDLIDALELDRKRVRMKEPSGKLGPL